MNGPLPRATDFTTVAVGDEVRVRHTFHADEVAAFARLSGDTNPLHVDPAFARTTAFGRPVVHGMLSAAHLSAIIGTRLPGPGALWFQQQFEFPTPVFVGDEVEFTLRVEHTSAATRTIVVWVEARNQHHAVVLKGRGTVMLVEHDADAAAVDLGAALVTGGSRGIGAAIARRLAADGRPVGVNYRVSRDAAERLAADIVAGGGQAVAVQGDVSDPKAVSELVRACSERLAQPIGILVNNASGPLPQAGFLDCRWEDFDAQFRVQLGGAVLCAHELLPGMAARGTGRIVNIGSTAAWGVPPPNAAPYVAAKAALAALTRALAVEFGPKGVCVNMVSPSMVETDLVAHVPERLRKVAAMQAPLRRLATPAHVAEVVAALCGPAGAAITGADIPVAAGSAM
jgi:3-oxoacyl-[acyl-carrier protein] reductase